MRALRAEMKKIKYRRLWQGVLLLLGIQILWYFWVFSRVDVQELDAGYFYGIMQILIMNSIFMPVLLAMIASRIWDAEHKGDTWKLLGTLQSKRSIYGSKFLIGAGYCGMIAVAQAVFVILSAGMFHFTQELPAAHMAWFVGTVFVVNLLIYLIQQILSMRYENQIVPLAVGLLGAFAGLFSYFFPEPLPRLVVWGYYGTLRSVDMYWDEATRISTYFARPMDFGFLAVVIGMTAAVYGIGRYMFLKRDYS